MRTNIVCILAFSVTSLASTTLLAQERCVFSDTIAECWDRYLKPDAMIETAKAERRAEEERELEREPTGVDTGGANLATNKQNLLPLMALSGLLGGSADSEDEDPATMVFDLNFLLPAVGAGGNNGQLQAVVNTEPQISEALLGALPEEGRDDLVGQLENRLGDLADYAIRFTYNQSSRFYGRTFEQYARRFDALSGAAVGAIPLPQSVADLTAAIAALEKRFPNTLPEDVEGVAFEDLPPEVASQVLLSVEKSARQLATFEADATQAMRMGGLAHFHQLLDNQPQLHVTVEKNFRDPLIGADELAVKATYEWSAVNFNASMSKDCHRALDTDKPDTKTAAACLGEYARFVADKKDAVARGIRFSFSGEYVDIDEETIDAGIQGVSPIDLDATRRLILSAGWNRDFNLDGEPISVDLIAEYQDIQDDPLRRDRGIARLTFTRQFNNMAIPFGIVYANHGEFLTDVDERLSAHIGLRFSMFDGNGDE